jgi:transcriptional regulator with XRE-family HTH domain
LPPAAARAIAQLGTDLSVARRRRRLTQAALAERMGASLSTVRRMEKGDERVPIQFYARALFLFGHIEALAHLLDPGDDDLGLAPPGEPLPRRVRATPPQSGES